MSSKLAKQHRSIKPSNAATWCETADDKTAQRWSYCPGEKSGPTIDWQPCEEHGSVAARNARCSSANTVKCRSTLGTMWCEQHLVRIAFPAGNTPPLQPGLFGLEPDSLARMTDDHANRMRMDGENSMPSSPLNSRPATIAPSHVHHRKQAAHGQNEAGRFGHRNGELLAESVKPGIKGRV